MRKPIKIAFLWHFHQPYYELNGEMVLPWVRLHAVKDYIDIPKIFTRYPKIKHTINLTPSLFEQISLYAEGKVSDKALILSQKKADELTETEKRYIQDNFFTINENNLLNPHPHYKYLFEKYKRGETYSTQDYTDLQVWYNLAWLGNLSAQEPFIIFLKEKQHTYSESEKNSLLEYHLHLMRILPTELRRLSGYGNLEFSFSPFYHPILPLISDDSHNYGIDYSDSNSADRHIRHGKSYIENLLDKRLDGSWPSEGSLSDAILDKYISQGAKWVATDESMLWKSQGDNQSDTSKYFRFEYSSGNDNSSISVFFRDTELSDNIGFKYMNMYPKDAAADFLYHISLIKERIVNHNGEEALDDAVVSIILDGENCWEFYYKNGNDFLHQFLEVLSDSQEIDAVFHRDATQLKPKNLDTIHSGSWINASFDIWAGDIEDKAAWELLHDANRVSVKNTEHEGYQAARKLLDICEGSDWFWWFGPEHNAPDRNVFDYLFRENLKKVYSLLGLDHPQNLDCPIMSQSQSSISDEKISLMNHHLGVDSWIIIHEQKLSTMHASSSLPQLIARSLNRIIVFGVSVTNTRDLEIIDLDKNILFSTVPLDLRDSFLLISESPLHGGQQLRVNSNLYDL